MPDETNNDKAFLPPEPVGKPFRGNPKQPFPFAVQGKPDSAASVFAEAAQLLAVTGNFMRPANGTFRTRLSDVTITLPTHEAHPQG